VIFKVALQMLLYKKARCLFSVVGIGLLFLLSTAQIGMLAGWCSTISAIPRHANVDVWIMAEQTTCWDYGSDIPRHRIQQVRNVPGVAWAEGLFVGFSEWQRPDGRRITVALVGLDSGLVGGPWDMREGRVDSVLLPNSIIVDELFLETLGVKGVGDEVELVGKRAVVRGISRQVRSFTANPFVFTSMKSAALYNTSYHLDDTTYVMVRARPGVAPEQLIQAIHRDVPGVEALTTRAFANRSIAFWMLETGAGLTVLLSSLLAVVVSAVVTSQTLYTITQDHLGNYATLLALGYRRSRLLLCVVLQGLLLNAGGIALGSLAFALVSQAAAQTPIPLETDPNLFGGLLGVSLGCCFLGSYLSLKVVWRVDPVTVFRA
jgi:putative ABC transport system permease protein